MKCLNCYSCKTNKHKLVQSIIDTLIDNVNIHIDLNNLYRMDWNNFGKTQGQILYYLIETNNTN